jgi:hypothetical protein
MSEPARQTLAYREPGAANIHTPQRMGLAPKIHAPMKTVFGWKPASAASRAKPLTPSPLFDSLLAWKSRHTCRTYRSPSPCFSWQRFSCSAPEHPSVAPSVLTTSAPVSTHAGGWNEPFSALPFFLPSCLRCQHSLTCL